VHIQSITSVAVINPDPQQSRALSVSALGYPGCSPSRASSWASPTHLHCTGPP